MSWSLLKLGDGCMGIYYTLYFKKKKCLWSNNFGKSWITWPPLGELQCVLVLGFMLLENRDYMGASLTTDLQCLARCPMLASAQEMGDAGINKEKHLQWGDLVPCFNLVFPKRICLWKAFYWGAPLKLIFWEMVSEQFINSIKTSLTRSQWVGRGSLRFIAQDYMDHFLPINCAQGPR